MTTEEKNIEEAAFKYLRRIIISKGGYWDEESQDVVHETFSGKQNVLNIISREQPRLVQFSTIEQSVKEYWQKGMYTEEEVLLILMNGIKDITLMSINDIKIKNWFEQNKNHYGSNIKTQI